MAWITDLYNRMDSFKDVIGVKLNYLNAQLATKVNLNGGNATGNLASAISRQHDAVTLGSNSTGLSIAAQVISLAAGYAIPTVAQINNWNDPYTSGENITIQSDKRVDMRFENNSWIRSKDGKPRMYFGTGGSTTDDTYFKRGYLGGEFWFLDADDSPLMKIGAGGVMRIYQLAGSGGRLLQADMSGSIFATNIDVNDIATVNWVDLNFARKTGNYQGLTVGNSTNWNGLGVDWATNNTNPIDVLGWDNTAQVNRPINRSGLLSWLNLQNDYAHRDSSNIINATDWRNNLDVYARTEVNNLLVNKITGTSGLSPQNFNFAIGDDGTRNFIQSFLGQRLDLNPLGNSVTINGYDVWTFGNFDPNSKANTSGYYSGLSVGQADNSTMWNGQNYLGATRGAVDYFMTYDISNGTWRPSTIADTQSVLGLNNANFHIVGPMIIGDSNNVLSNSSSTMYYLGLANNPWGASQDIIGAISNFGGKDYGYDIASAPFYNSNNPQVFVRTYGNSISGGWKRLLTEVDLTNALSLNFQQVTDNGNTTTNNLVANGLVVNYGYGWNNGAREWLMYSGSGWDDLYLRDMTDGNMIMRYGTSVVDIYQRNLNVDGTILTTSHGTSADWYQGFLNSQNALNLNLQQVVTNGNTSTLEATFGGVKIGYQIGGFLGFDSTKEYAFLNNVNSAGRVLTGGLLASDNYADVSLIPANGIYSKGNIHTSSSLTLLAIPTNSQTRNWHLSRNIYVFGDFALWSTDYQGNNPRYDDFYIAPNGNVGLGNLTPNHKLDVNGTIGTALHGTSADWKYTYDNALMNRGNGFVSNTDANTLTIGTEIVSIETANGSGNTNFPHNSNYGIFSRQQSRNFTTDWFSVNGEDMWFKTWYNPNGAGSNSWRKIWDSVNLVNPATETWVNNNFASNTVLSDYVSRLNNNQNIDGVKSFTGTYTEWVLNGDSTNNARGFLQSLPNTFYIGTLNNKNFAVYAYAEDKITVYSDRTSFKNVLEIPNATAPNHAVAFGQLANYALLSQVPTNVSQLVNDANYTTLPLVQSWVSTQGYTNTTIGANGGNFTSGAISVTQGTGITVTKSGNSIIISTTGSGGGGITSIETDDPNIPGPTASNMPIHFNSHVAYGRPSTDISDEVPGNMEMIVETGDVIRFYGSYDNTFIDTPAQGTTYNIDIDGIKKHIYNIIFQSTGGGASTVQFGKGLYAGDQINITVPRGSQINLNPQGTSLISSFGNEVQTHANLIWLDKEDAWALIAYN